MPEKVISKTKASEMTVHRWDELLSCLVSQGIIEADSVEELYIRDESVLSEDRTDAFDLLGSRLSELAVTIRKNNKLSLLVRNVQEIRLLYEIVQSANSETDPDRVFESMLTCIHKIINFDNATLFIIDRNTGKLAEVARYGERVDLIGNFDFELGNGFSAWVAKNGKPILLPRINSRNSQSDSVVHSFLSVPLIYHREIKGIINLSHSRENSFSPEHLKILTLIGSQMAKTIESVISSHDLHYRAIYDELTGAYNRWYYQARLKEEIYRARRYRHTLSIVMLDIDHFKQFNDSHGHLAGDYVLRYIASFLKKSLRETDIVGRYGGEEFLLILPETDNDKAYLISERLRRGLETWDGDSLQFTTQGITASFGITLLEDSDRGFEELIKKADLSMYRAKRLGRNRICIFEGSKDT